MGEQQQRLTGGTSRLHELLGGRRPSGRSALCGTTVGGYFRAEPAPPPVGVELVMHDVVGKVELKT